MAYPGYGAPPPGGYGGVSDERVKLFLGKEVSRWAQISAQTWAPF